ncbi:Bcr/CflA family efflux MFS transporter [Sphingobium sp. B11D3A]|uniref:Bcr/CflA family efflux MFS transporter n=1 Tax=Sphingobium sp. B11D3A TaxID=2940574 RepID=UPI0029CAAC2B|nr:Bcr/CflA family efflux MFS transporter [Sphingobium sp. B11D3A]
MLTDHPSKAAPGAPAPSHLPLGHVLLLAALTATLPAAIEGVSPALPAIASGLGADPTHMPTAMSAFVISFAIAQLLGGMCADALGRRPVVIGGLLLFTLAGLLGAFAESFPMLLAARALQGVGAAAAVLLARTMVRDQLGREDAARALALIGIIMGFTPALAPLISGVLVATGGWRAPLVALAVMGGVLVVVTTLRLPETLAREERLPFDLRALFRTLSGLARSRALMAYIIANAFAYSGILLFSSAAPQVIIDYLGVSAAGYAAMLSLATAGFIAGNFLSYRLVRRLGVDGTLRVGVLFQAAGPLVMLLAVSAWPHIWVALVIPQMLYTMGWGIVQPQTQAGALSTHPHSIGQASALLGFVQLALAGLIVAIFSRVTAGEPASLALALMVCGGMATVCAWHLVPRQRG